VCILISKITEKSSEKPNGCKVCIAKVLVGFREIVFLVKVLKRKKIKDQLK
jgi:hypothetical protein